MKAFFLVFFMFFSLSSFADKLPTYRNLKSMFVPKVINGETLTLSFDIPLPRGQKINTRANSKILIHEKRNDSWSLVKKIDVNNKLLFEGMNINFTEKIKLKSPKSDLAISSTIYHCATNNKGSCYIDNFQYKFSRSSNGKEIALVKLFPTKE